MKGFSLNIEKETRENADYRRVLYTTHYSQLVVMSIKPGEEIGNEIHGVDQFIRIEQGNASVILNNGETKYILENGWSVNIPAGTYHNVINVGTDDLKLYTLYAIANHPDGIVEHTKAEEKDEPFDGKTTE